MMTIRELLELVDEANEGRVPTAKSLRNSGVEMILQERIEENSTVSVYRNGYVICQIDRHVTVFPLKTSGKKSAESGDYSYLRASDYPDFDCIAGLSIEGYDRISMNLDKAYEKKKVSYSQESEDWNVMAAPENEMDRVVDRDLIAWLLNQITPRQKLYIQKYYFEDLDTTQIASQLGVSKQTVSEGIRTAIKKMRRLLEEA